MCSEKSIKSFKSLHVDLKEQKHPTSVQKKEKDLKKWFYGFERSVLNPRSSDLLGAKSLHIYIRRASARIKPPRASN
jgi:hypothetical protein